MTVCALADTADVELYFYDELNTADRERVAAHVRGCTACRQRLDDLHAIRRALAETRVVDAPPAGDWSGFMRRLDTAVGIAAAGRGPSAVTATVEQTGGTWRVRHLVAIAAALAVLVTGVFMAWTLTHKPSATLAGTSQPPKQAPHTASVPVRETNEAREERALREVSAEHLERSKLVVLGLATRNPQQTHAADWQFERQLAGSLLPETRLYRLAAQERGVSDVAHVMRDLETVLLEASMTDGRDRESLERVQRLIARRGLVSKMQIVATSAGL